jgi:NIMA-interacting peptidyl-prolyl cis-trans isomerase 1
MSGWEVRFSNSKQLPYFYHAASGQSVWDKPADLNDEQVAQLPGAKQYLGGAGGGGGGGGKPGQVRSSHILAKHAGSRRPSSWREVSLSTVIQISHLVSL